MSLNSINNGCFLGDTLIQANSLLPHSTTGLKVTTIELSNITDLSLNSKKADFLVNFDSNSLSGPLKSIRVPSMSFSISSNKVDQCLGSLSAEKTCTSMGGIWNSQGCTFPSQAVEPSMMCVGMGGVMINGKCSLTQCPLPTTFGGFDSSGSFICNRQNTTSGTAAPGCPNGVCSTGNKICKFKSTIAGNAAATNKEPCMTEHEGQNCNLENDGFIACVLWSMGSSQKVLTCICE